MVATRQLERLGLREELRRQGREAWAAPPDSSRRLRRRHRELTWQGRCMAAVLASIRRSPATSRPVGSGDCSGPGRAPSTSPVEARVLANVPSSSTRPIWRRSTSRDATGSRSPPLPGRSSTSPSTPGSGPSAATSGRPTTPRSSTCGRWKISWTGPRGTGDGRRSAPRWRSTTSASLHPLGSRAAVPGGRAARPGYRSRR